MPRRPHQPTDDQRKMVETLSGFGVPHEAIAKVIGIDRKTMTLWYRDELDRAAVIASAKVAQNLYNIAMGQGREAVTAAIFWLKCRAGWKDGGYSGNGGDIGKKEQTELLAQHSDQGTEWERLLN